MSRIKKRQTITRPKPVRETRRAVEKDLWNAMQGLAALYAAGAAALVAPPPVQAQLIGPDSTLQGGTLNFRGFDCPTGQTWLGGGCGVPTAAPTAAPTPSPSPTPAPTESNACRNLRTQYGAVTGNVMGERGGTIYGTNNVAGSFTADSWLPKAALHAGLVAEGQVKYIYVIGLNYQPGFVGSTANGVTSYDYAAEYCAYRLSLTPDGSTPAPTPTPTPTPPPTAAPCSGSYSWGGQCSAAYSVPAGTSKVISSAWKDNVYAGVNLSGGISGSATVSCSAQGVPSFSGQTCEYRGSWPRAYNQNAGQCTTWNGSRVCAPSNVYLFSDGAAQYCGDLMGPGSTVQTSTLSCTGSPGGVGNWATWRGSRVTSTNISTMASGNGIDYSNGIASCYGWMANMGSYPYFVNSLTCTRNGP